MKLLKRIWNIIMALFTTKVKAIEANNIDALIILAKSKRNEVIKRGEQRLIKIAKVLEQVKRQYDDTAKEAKKMHDIAVAALKASKEAMAADAALRAEELEKFASELDSQVNELNQAYESLKSTTADIASDYDLKISRLELAAVKMNIKETVAEVCEVNDEATGDSLNDEIKNITELISSNTDAASAVIRVNTDLGLKTMVKSASDAQLAKEEALNRLRASVISVGTDSE